MTEEELAWIATETGARSAERGARIQSLWSGYGELFRVRLHGADHDDVVVKWVKPPRGRHDPGHVRKCRSYDVETAWYRTYAPRCPARVPALLASRRGADQWLLVLEDLDAAGFPERRHRLDAAGTARCLAWLARLHAHFLGIAPEGLWKTGTYWHLATRRDELAEIVDPDLRAAAPVLDRRLAAARFRTLLHGDAKAANFCFGRAGVAAVDFQYAGGGCGMRDVAYLLHGGAEEAEPSHLDDYFRRLREELAGAVRKGDLEVDVDALEAEWRALYPIALADFGRFLAGWSPGHWRSDARTRRRVAEVIRAL